MSGSSIGDLALLLPSVFWLLLLLPGLAIARRFAPEELASGPIAGIAVCAAATLTCLAPLVAALYLVGTVAAVPIEVLAAILVAAIAGGAIACLRMGLWRRAGSLAIALLSIEAAILLVDLVLSWRVGSMLGADARIHVTRIRFLWEHGLSNLDPFVADGSPYPIYHTNLWHALIAAGARLCGCDPLVMWHGSLPAAKALIATGLAYSAWALLGSRWAAAVAATMAVVLRGPTTFSIYPNQLAPWFLLPMLAGVALRACERRGPTTSADSPGRAATKAALLAWCLGMFHPLYAGFAVAAFAPVLLLASAWRWLGARDLRPAAVLAALLLAALPSPLIGRALTVPDRSVAPSAGDAAQPAEGGLHEEIDGDAGVEAPTAALARLSATAPPMAARPPGFRVDDAGRLARAWGRGFTGGGGWRLWVLLGGVVLAGLLLRRAAPLLAAGAIATIRGIMLWPPLCDAALRVLGAVWMLQRFETIADVLWVPLSAPLAAALLEPWIRWRLLQTLLVPLAIPAALWHGWYQAPYDWASYRARALQPEATRVGRELRPMLRLQQRLAEWIPPGSVVVCEPALADRTTMLHGVRVIAAQRSSTGVDGLRWRTRQLRRMLAGRTDEATRGELFERFGATHLVATELPDWVELWAAERRRFGGYWVVTLAAEPDWSMAPRVDLRRAGRLLDRDRPEEAAAILAGALETDPGMHLGWFRLGEARLRLGEAAAARDALALAIEIEPGDPRYPLLLGNALVELGEVEASMASFEAAASLALAEDDLNLAAVARFNLGNSLFRLDRMVDAIDAYQAALDLVPEYHNAAIWLAEAQRIERLRKSTPPLDHGADEASGPGGRR